MSQLLSTQCKPFCGFSLASLSTTLIATLLTLSLSVSTCLARDNDYQRLSDIAYGPHSEERLDVYKPINATNAPVIFMVHGGAWRIGDKAARKVVNNKVKRWVKRGFIFISINYPMLPETLPLDQARSVAKALRVSQKQVIDWGGSPEHFILMGHSAGAHLVSLISTQPALTEAKLAGVKRDLKPSLSWLGTVSIDSAAYDVTQIMTKPNPPRFYKKAFGKQPNYWKQASPKHRMTTTIRPFFAICSLERKDGACDQAESFTNKAKSLGTTASLLKVNLSHSETNANLGKQNRYTESVEEFLKTLSPRIATLLTQ